MLRKTKSGSFLDPLDRAQHGTGRQKHRSRHVIDEKKPKWSHVVVVADRHDADLTGRVYPKADLKAFNSLGCRREESTIALFHSLKK